jgi:hypothetical protein
MSAKVADLVNTARNYFSTLPLPTRPSIGFEIHPHSTVREILRGLFTHHDDVVLGEYHTDTASKEALIDNMDLLRDNGVVIALENTLFEHHYEPLRQYLLAGVDEMPLQLAAFLNTVDRAQNLQNSHGGFSALVRAAKRARVQIVPTDTQTSFLTSSELSDPLRVLNRFFTQNYIHKFIIDRVRSRGQKVVHFFGAAHSFQFNRELYGLRELFGAPSLFLKCSRSTSSKHTNKCRRSSDTIFQTFF